MDDQINIVTLIALIVAVVAILKLRSVLGRRTDDDDARVDERYRQHREAEEVGASSDNVVTLPNVHQQDAGHNPDQEEYSRTEAEERIRDFAGKHKSVETGLLAILDKDHAFDPNNFIAGARHAYELIVTAFAEGNRSELKKLLSSDVFSSFDQAISDRERRGELIDQSFVGIEKSDVLEAEVSDRFAQITIRFVSQLISATRDGAGEVVSGDTQRIKEVTDIWTFSRDVSTTRALENPNWQLVATQAPH